jgi:threonine dehydrogenase-like Zn-dependent dehydrogenase
MPTMKSVQTGAPGAIEVVDIERPVPGPKDVLLRVRACGICGTDVSFLHMGGMPLGPGGQMTAVPLGHEPAGEVIEVGAEVTGLKVGDRVVGTARPATDIYIDAAGVGVVLNTALASAKWGARLVMVAVQKKPEPIDLSAMLRSEMTFIASMGYPTEIFEVTPQLAKHWERFSQLISHRVPFSDVKRAFPTSKSRRCWCTATMTCGHLSNAPTGPSSLADPA